MDLTPNKLDILRLKVTKILRIFCLRSFVTDAYTLLLLLITKIKITTTTTTTIIITTIFNDDSSQNDMEEENKTSF